MSFFSRLRAAVDRFMIGRYGYDAFGKSLLLFWFASAAINLLFHSFLLSLAGFVFGIVFFYRFLSKNHVKRRKENADWYQFSQKAKGWYQHISVRIRERKISRFFRCPYCKAPIRMPRKIGKFNVRCPKCKSEFQKEFKR